PPLFISFQRNIFLCISRCFVSNELGWPEAAVHSFPCKTPREILIDMSFVVLDVAAEEMPVRLHHR
ncbi:unnamed protein product, partial [Ectocarpus sp. 12 AP-2014]